MKIKQKWYLAQMSTEEYNDLNSAPKFQILKRKKKVRELSWGHTLNLKQDLGFGSVDSLIYWDLDLY